MSWFCIVAIILLVPSIIGIYCLVKKEEEREEEEQREKRRQEKIRQEEEKRRQEIESYKRIDNNLIKEFEELLKSNKFHINRGYKCSLTDKYILSIYKTNYDRSIYIPLNSNNWEEGEYGEYFASKEDCLKEVFFKCKCGMINCNDKTICFDIIKNDSSNIEIETFSLLDCEISEGKELHLLDPCIYGLFLENVYNS